MLLLKKVNLVTIYLSGMGASALSTGISTLKEIPIVKKFGSKVSERLMSKFKESNVYKTFGNFIKSGEEDAAKMQQISAQKALNATTKTEAQEIEEEIAENLAKNQDEILTLEEKLAAQAEKKSSLVQQIAESEGNVGSLSRKLHKLNKTIVHNTKKLNQLQAPIQQLMEKKDYTTGVIKEIEKEISTTKWESYALRWKTVALSSACKSYTNGCKKVEDAIKESLGF